MLTKTRSTPVHSPAPGVIPETITSRVDAEFPIAHDSARAPSEGDHASPGRGRDRDRGDASAPTAARDRETRRERSRRKAHRSRLHVYAILSVALVAFLIALAASNTAHVKVNWVFGSSQVSLVWLGLFAAILGWLLGLLATAAFHWRTRAPRRRGGPA